MLTVSRKREFHQSANGLLWVPHGGLPKNQQPESHQRRFPEGLFGLPHHDVLGWSDIQSQQHAVPADRRAHSRAVRPVPREREFHHRSDGLRGLSHDGFQEDQQSQSHYSRIPDRLLSLPYHRILGRRDIQSQQHALPADRRAHYRGLRELPREQQLHQPADRLRIVPHVAVQLHHQSTPQIGWLPHHLPALPYHRVLGGSDVQSQQHALPADRRAYHRGLCELPREQQLHQPADRLRIVPHVAVQLHHQSTPQLGWLTHHLPALPYRRVLRGSYVQSQQHALPADRRAYHRGLCELPREQQLHQPADRLRIVPH